MVDDLKIPISLTEYDNLSPKRIAILIELQEKRNEAKNAALERQQNEQTKMQNKAAAMNQIRAAQRAEARTARHNRRF